MHTPKFTLPQQIYIYEFNQDDDGKPLYAVAETVEDIPADHDGGVIGYYTICTERKFRVRKEVHD